MKRYFILAAAIAIATVTAPAWANGNTVCSNFIRVAYKIDNPAQYVLRASHPAVVRSIIKMGGIVPPEQQRAHGASYGVSILYWCSIHPNSGTWEASEYALNQANKEIFYE
jgi:hypothetical protein